VEDQARQTFSGSLTVKTPSIEISALVVSLIITLVSGEWWHWVAVIAAIVVVRVFKK